ncbi:hypothetical protein EX30DRAFT_383565 [Ascodesmis nigricans]|uniref:Uncharacterized protein n=1 Tax=Ascodesmis nigricans TaxID=341454 RepID=A0A4S2MRQ2_9PEZI|nr:hypothetical protein EX30DRAFT_383565 [Ascodesmis nigricans]
MTGFKFTKFRVLLHGHTEPCECVLSPEPHQSLYCTGILMTHILLLRDTSANIPSTTLGIRTPSHHNPNGNSSHFTTSAPITAITHHKSNPHKPKSKPPGRSASTSSIPSSVVCSSHVAPRYAMHGRVYFIKMMMMVMDGCGAVAEKMKEKDGVGDEMSDTPPRGTPPSDLAAVLEGAILSSLPT